LWVGELAMVTRLLTTLAVTRASPFSISSGKCFFSVVMEMGLSVCEFLISAQISFSVMPVATPSVTRLR
jgi:hypothetical protein